MDLYQTENPSPANENLPLSKRMMPHRLDDFQGQSHLTAVGKPVRTMLENRICHSMIFFGPPATGKTSLARIIAEELSYHFESTNALTLTSDSIRNLLQNAEFRNQNGKRTIVFVDEIHRLNKPKQDAFLSSLEHGIIIMIGATTENPYFIMQPALRSRLFIYEFFPLTHEDKSRILDHALEADEFLRGLNVQFDGDAKNALIESAGDPRMMLNTLEMVVLNKAMSDEIVIGIEDIASVLQKPETYYSQADGHYDVISAFIKSVRGSDPDAAMYYLTLMMDSGEDVLFIARRLIILASEDVGLAYPEALPVAVACYTALEKIGMPEGALVLAETTCLLASVPKSNSTTIALSKARADIQGGNVMPVPMHVRDAHYSGAKKLGRGIDYKYPHDYPNHYIRQTYTEKPVHYFDPGELGFEKRIKEWLEKLK